MTKAKKNPTADFLHECFTYDDGVLIWKVRPTHHFKSNRSMNMWNAKFSLKPAGRPMTTRSGNTYLQVGILGGRYLNHRLILEMFGREVGDVVDHINRCSTDNRVENLRSVTQSVNLLNQSGWKKRDLPHGVCKKANGKFIAYATIDHRHTHLGSFKTVEEASAAATSARCSR
jgi:hypothetical protein